MSLIRAIRPVMSSISGAAASADDRTWTKNNSILSPYDGNLVEVYHCDENSGNLIGAINAYNGVDQNSVTSMTGKYRGARLFTAANSEYFKVPATTYDYSALFATKQFAVSVWIKTASGDDYFIGNMGNPTNGFNIHVRGAGTVRAQFSNADSGTGTLTSTNTYDDDDWHHVCLLVNGANATLYVDYDDTDTTSSLGTIGDAGNDFFVGQSSQNGQYWNGGIDELCIWSTYLSDSAAEALSDESWYKAA